MNLQDAFLNQVRLQKIMVNIHLTNGEVLNGVVRGFDSFIVLLDAKLPGRTTVKETLIYKHAVVSIMPSASLGIFNNQDQKSEPKSPQQANDASVDKDKEEAKP